MAKTFHQLLIYLLIFLTTLNCQGQKPIYDPQAVEFNSKVVEFINVQHFDSALYYLNEATKIDPTYYVAYGNKSTIYCSLKDFKKALLEIQKQISAKPDLAEAWTFGGILYDKLGDSLNAKIYYKKSVEIFDTRLINSDSKKYQDANRRNRAVTLILMGQDQRGRNELRKLKEDYPDDEHLDDLIKLIKKDYITQILND